MIDLDKLKENAYISRLERTVRTIEKALNEDDFDAVRRTIESRQIAEKVTGGTARSAPASMVEISIAIAEGFGIDIDGLQSMEISVAYGSLSIISLQRVRINGSIPVTVDETYTVVGPGHAQIANREIRSGAPIPDGMSTKDFMERMRFQAARKESSVLSIRGYPSA